MNKEERGLLLLIKSAISGEKYYLPEGIDFEKTFKVAVKHGVTSLAYNGAHNCGVLKDKSLSRIIFPQICKEMFANQIQTFSFEELVEKFESNSIEYVPLKGVRLKNIYPKPEMRTMGDIDILIKLEQYEKIKSIMLELGYTHNVESDHELVWDRKSVCIELHKRLIPSYNKDFYAYFGDGWRLAEKNEKKRGEYLLKPDNEFIFLFTHLCKHYRDSGIGIKHLLDVYLYKKKNSDLDFEYIKNEMIKLKIYQFYQNIENTLDVWFNNGETDDITEYITNTVFNRGVFSSDQAKVLSSALKQVKEGKSVKQVKKQKFFTAIFTPYKSMCEYYPFLSKFAVLLPFMWVYHLFKRLFTKGKLKNYNRQMSDIKKEDIELYQKSLNFVGLDYNFEKSDE